MSALLQKSNDQTLFWFIAVSIIVHAVVAWSLQTVRQPRIFERQTIEIALAPVGGNQDQIPETAEPAAQPKAAKPAPQPEPTPPQPQPKPEPTPAPPKAKPVAKPQPDPQPTPAATAKPAEPAAQPTPTQARTDPAPSNPSKTLSDVRKLLESRSGTGASGAGEGDHGYALPGNVKGRLYFSQLQAAVRTAWSVPQGVNKQHVIIDVMIGQNGKLIHRSIRESSGDALLDRSALAALDAADLPAPPASFKTPLRLALRLIPPDN